MTNIYSNLPKVVSVLGIDDAGEFGAAICPHCGAQGRYVIWFKAIDGQEYGAMRGCFGHFPKSPLAAEHLRIMDKQKEYEKKGWQLASWDNEILDAVDAVANGQITEQDGLDRVKNAKRQQSAWMQQRFGRRR